MESQKNLDILDSSAWIECLDEGPNTVHFGPILEKLPDLIVPSITITEVRKVVLRHRNAEGADRVTDSMQSCQVIDLNPDLARFAADLALQYKLPLADSIIYATCLQAKATLWTQDPDFKDLESVQYYEKQKK